MDSGGSQWSKVVLRGNHPAKIDEKGRLKIPNEFRVHIQERYGSQVYVTSSHREQGQEGAAVNIYPMPVWEEIERKLAALPASLPERDRYVNRVNYFGRTAEIDKQGRVPIHLLLRESAAMTGDVNVLGQLDHLDVWNRERFVTRLANEPFTEADARKLSEYGI